MTRVDLPPGVSRINGPKHFFTWGRIPSEEQKIPAVLGSKAEFLSHTSIWTHGYHDGCTTEIMNRIGQARNII